MSYGLPKSTLWVLSDNLVVDEFTRIRTWVRFVLGASYLIKIPIDSTHRIQKKRKSFCAKWKFLRRSAHPSQTIYLNSYYILLAYLAIDATKNPLGQLRPYVALGSLAEC